jgi:hypothetical protein
MKSLRLLVVVLAFALPACATSTTGGTDQPRREPNRLTTVEIRGAHYRNAFELVQALRPAWITTRGQISVLDPLAGEVVVYLDGIRAGGAAFLRQISLTSVDSMEYMGATAASARYGINHAGGAILVSTRMP